MHRQAASGCQPMQNISTAPGQSEARNAGRIRSQDRRPLLSSQNTDRLHAGAQARHHLWTQTPHNEQACHRQKTRRHNPPDGFRIPAPSYLRPSYMLPLSAVHAPGQLSFPMNQERPRNQIRLLSEGLHAQIKNATL